MRDDVSMYIPCELFVKRIAPKLRAAVAKILIEKYGYTQIQVSQVLGLKQATISKYLRVNVKDENILKFAEEIADMMANGAHSTDICSHICKTCIRERAGGWIYRVYREHGDLPKGLDLTECILGALNVLELDFRERVNILRRLEEAVSLLEKEPKVVTLVPEVRMNIVMSTSSPRSINDIAGIPGRLTIVHGRVKATSKPEFGASKHTASVLLIARKVNEKNRACICVKYDDKVNEALMKLNFKVVWIDREKFEDADIVDILEKILDEIPHEFDAIIDPGWIGIEPIAYIFGNDALDVAEKVCKIAKCI